MIINETNSIYKCETCGGVFIKGWSDEEATAEFASAYGEPAPDEELCVICDDCHIEFQAWTADQRAGEL